MPKLRRRIVSVVVACVLFGLGVGVGLLVPIVVRPPLVLGQDAVVAGGGGQARFVDAGGKVLVVDPDGEASAVLLLYPGGLVRPQAYEWLGHALAKQGVRTIIPEMPFDLAVLDANRADLIMEEQLHTSLPVVLAGHSLGGAMAAQYAAKKPDRINGLVLMAAYPPDGTDLTSFAGPVSLLVAEHDGVASAEKTQAGLQRLPAQTQQVAIGGAVHSFFGRYGAQQGDGTPTVPRDVAEKAIATAVLQVIDQVR